ncbi:hypothetical protein C922_00880 [Plasmodium inui San Antonio 1]|uniref:Homologous recombination OB-fold protein OB-fold domain-containing protein n=1 Tax=Plasmodium inui San Antonio 1 TaxID=1237626 RepID=W7AHH9_9APIC|nr:hypothetical protein C922_00880 [Plasmodium inui San Antonio 1]EUD68484.1 hypothetical protein C922_00880 [Plasmodium inui San Antonio 1]
MLDENLSCLLDESDDECARKNEVKRRKQELRQKGSSATTESGGQFFPTSVLNFNIRNIRNLNNFFKNANAELAIGAHYKAAIQGTASHTSTSLPPSGEANQNGNAPNRKDEQLRKNSNSKTSLSGKNGTIAAADAAKLVHNDASNERNGRYAIHSLNYLPSLEIEKQEIAKRKNLEASSSQGSKCRKVTEGNPRVVENAIERNAVRLREKACLREGEAVKPIAPSTKVCGKKRSPETNLYSEVFKAGEARKEYAAEGKVAVTKSAAKKNEEGILKKRNARVEGTDRASASMHGEKEVNWSNGRSPNRVVRFVTNEDGKDLPPRMNSKEATKGIQIANKAKWYSSRNSNTAPAMESNSTTSTSLLSGASKLNSIRYTSQPSDRSIEADPLAQQNRIEKRKELIFCFSFIKYNSWVKALKILNLPLDPFHLSINAHRYVTDGGEEPPGKQKSGQEQSEDRHKNQHQDQMASAPSPDSHEPGAAVSGPSSATLRNGLGNGLRNGLSNRLSNRLLNRAGGTDSGAPSFLYTHNIHNILRNKRFANYRIEKMMVIVKSIRCRSHGYFIVAMDPSGQMPASIHKEVQKEYKKHINIGSTLILKDVTVFETMDNFPYLIITLRSLVRVIKAEETSYAVKDDILKRIHGGTRLKA